MPEAEPHPFYVFRNAVFYDRAEDVALLEHDPSLLEVRSPHLGETVLHWAAVENEREVITWLLERGANINTVNDFGETPLMDAASLEYEELCAFLIEHGANVAYTYVSENSVYKSALQVAAKSGHLAIMQLFLRHVPATDDINRYFDDYHAVRLLRKIGAITTLLRERGLQNRWDESDAVRGSSPHR